MFTGYRTVVGLQASATLLCVTLTHTPAVISLIQYMNRIPDFNLHLIRVAWYKPMGTPMRGSYGCLYNICRYRLLTPYEYFQLYARKLANRIRHNN